MDENERKFLVAKIDFTIGGFKSPDEAEQFTRFIAGIINATKDLRIIDGNLGIGVAIHRDDVAEIDPDGKPVLKDGSSLEDVFKDLMKGQDTSGFESNKPDWNKHKN